MSFQPVSTDFDGRTVRLELSDLGAVEEFFANAGAQEGFLLPLPTSPKLFDVLDLELSCGDGFEIRFAARVIQVFDRLTAPPEGRYGVAFQMEAWDEARETELQRKLAQSRAGEAAGSTPPEVDASETLGTSPIFRIKSLNPSERMRLASKANRTERQILLRDSSPQVLLGLLSNPQLDSEEVLTLVRSTHANGAILQRVAEDRRYSVNAEIRAAVARHPKTPTPVALRLLDTLRTPDLQILARSSAVREQLRRAALKIYLGRLSSR